MLYSNSNGREMRMYVLIITVSRLVLFFAVAVCTKHFPTG